MRRKTAALAAALLLALFPCTALAAPSTSAQAYAVVDGETGRGLFSKNAEEKLPMASTTKVMTCLVALERCSLDEIVTVDPAAAGLEGTSMYLSAGETLTVSDLLYGLMMSSGNDAAAALAYHIAGGIEQFAALMNQKAQEIGAESTHFVNPHGLPAEGHYTTASDLAKIAAYALKNQDFARIVSTKSMDLPADDDSPARYLRTRNKMLTMYDGGIGVKTGYTKAAGKCLVSAAERDGTRYVGVVLADPNMWEDSFALMDEAFADYKLTCVQESGETARAVVEGGLAESVGLEISEDMLLPLSEQESKMIEIKLDVPDSVSAPVKKGDVLGSVSAVLNGEVLMTADVTAAESVEEITFEYHLQRIISQWLSRLSLGA